MLLLYSQRKINRTVFNVYRAPHARLKVNKLRARVIAKAFTSSLSQVTDGKEGSYEPTNERKLE